MSDSVVLGYHGTSVEHVDAILRNGFKPSASNVEWLGSGVYFFEDGPVLAQNWATGVFGDKGVVLQADLSLGHCLDRKDERWSSYLRSVHDMLIKKHRESGLRLPTQNPGRKLHGLDCAVINFACGLLNEVEHPIDSVRSPFREGDPLWQGSAFHAQDHVQVSMRNTELITNIKLHEE